MPIFHFHRYSGRHFLKNKNGLFARFSHIGRPFVGSLKFTNMHLPTAKKITAATLHPTSTFNAFMEKADYQNGAGNEIRTRDTKLGKLVLYQLSYARLLAAHLMLFISTCQYVIKRLQGLFRWNGPLIFLANFR
jgi:hypothetical protein